MADTGRAPIRGHFGTGLAEIPSSRGLPDLGMVEFVLLGPDKTLNGPAAELADAILESGIRV